MSPLGTDLPATMRAILHTQTPFSMTYTATQPVPFPGPDEYLIKVHATAITTNELLWPRPPTLNASHPGCEAAGTIITTPTGTAHPKFIVGDQIYFRTQYPRAGSAREYSIALEPELAHRPKTISAVEAASVPMSALTAWQGLFVQAGLENPCTVENPPRILVHGASGGSGLFFVQLASLAGYPVTGVCSGKNAALVRSLGSMEVIDYTATPDWQSTYAKTFDVVIDCVGGTTQSALWQTLRPQGQLIALKLADGAPWKWELDAPKEGVAKGVSGKFYIMEVNGEQLQLVTGLIEQGKVKPVVDSVWELEEYEQAFERLDTGRAVGKVVFKVADEV